MVWLVWFLHLDQMNFKSRNIEDLIFLYILSTLLLNKKYKNRLKIQVFSHCQLLFNRIVSK